MQINESGRSMVEMLGVLAIIGVLSVAGIAGYTMAMRSYRANEIVHAASILYAAARSNNGGTGGLATDYNSNFGNNAGAALPGSAQVIKYCGAADADCSGTFPHILVQTANNPDCLAVQNKIGTVSTNIMYIANADTCGNGDTIKIYFNDN